MSSHPLPPLGAPVRPRASAAARVSRGLLALGVAVLALTVVASAGGRHEQDSAGVGTAEAASAKGAQAPPDARIQTPPPPATQKPGTTTLPGQKPATPAATGQKPGATAPPDQKPGTQKPGTTAPPDQKPGTTPGDKPAPAGLLKSTAAWALELEASPSADLATDGARIYVPLRDGRLLAVALDTGKTIWSHAVTTSLAPSLAGGALFVAAEGVVEALDPSTGQARWRLPVDGGLSAPPRVIGDVLVAGSRSGEIIVARADSGERVWTRNVGACLAGRPDAAEGRLYLPLDDGRVVAVDGAAGTPLWERQLGEAATGVLHAGGRIYVGSLDDNFYCLSAGDGREQWRWRCGADVVAHPVIDGKSVHFVALDNLLRALDKANGALRWSCTLPLRPASAPVLADDVFIVSGHSARIVACSTRDGRVTSQYRAAADLAIPAHLVPLAGKGGALLVFVTGEGRMEAWRVPSKEGTTAPGKDQTPPSNSGKGL